MDSSPFSDICGYRRVYLILTLDDHSRKILSGGFFNSDNVYNNMLVLRRVIEKYGLFKMLYTDNASLFKYLRYKEWSYKVYRGEMRFYQNNPDKQITTEIEEALLQLGIPLLTHYPGHPRAKGKIERIFRFINDRFVKEYRFKVKRLCELNNLFFSWVDWYNNT
jgi:putative transposase